MAWKRPVVLLCLHGIGTYIEEFRDVRTRFDRKLWAGLYGELGEALSDNVIWTPVVWSQPDLEARQRELIEDRDEWEKVFKFVASALTDAAAFQFYNDHRSGDSNYAKSLGAIYSALKGAEAEIKRRGFDPEDVPIVTVAQSMGCHVFSTYAWDIQNAPKRVAGSAKTPTPFARLDTLSSVFFTGCNIPILTAGVDPKKKIPLRLLRHETFADVQRWVNIYDPDDLLGYPIRDGYAEYYDPGPEMQQTQAHYGRDPKTEISVVDLETELSVFDVGLGALTPLAHLKYWQSDNVHRMVASTLKGHGLA